MIYMLSILIWICMFIVLFTTGTIKLFFLGVQIGLLILQIICFKKEVNK